MRGSSAPARSPTRAQAALKTDLDNLKAALDGVNPAEVFVPAISPASFEDWNKNEYYKTDEDYVVALGEAMRTEYQAIIDAGFLLQIDDPRLVTYYILHPDESVADCRKWARAARRGAQSCAARHPDREDPLPHLLRHQHGPARP